MRKIKFRAWDKENKRMIKPSGNYGSMLHWRIESGNNGHWGMFDRKRICGDADDSGVLMQYTDLKDKNGKEIYEGDIVAQFNFKGKDFRCEVIYKNGAFGYETPTFKQFISYASNDHFEWNNGKSDKIQVLGNIYENPELLEVKNE